MHRQPARPFAVRPDCALSSARSPLQALEESFLALASAAEPLALPAGLVCAEPEEAQVSVDRARTLLAHPATAPELRARCWREVVRRAQQIGEPWGTVAVAMTVPVLRRMLSRLARPAHLERAEVEQEALAAVATTLPAVDIETADVGRELFSAADRAVHRLAYAARRQAVRETCVDSVHLGRLTALSGNAVTGCSAGPEAAEAAASGGEGEDLDEYSVLARAVHEHVLDVEEARLIARTRLNREPMQHLAVERGVSLRQLYRHRAAAEEHLAAHLCRHAQGLYDGSRAEVS